MSQRPSPPAPRAAHPAPVAPRRARRRGWLVLATALGGALLAAGVAAFLAFGTQTGTASLEAQHLCDSLVAHDYATLYASLSLALQREGTEAQFIASQRELDGQRGAPTACTFHDAAVQGATATFTLAITRQGTGMAQGTVHLVLESGSWKVDSYDASVI